MNIDKFEPDNFKTIAVHTETMQVCLWICTAPIVPTQNEILTEVNSTFVTLAMDTWLNGGCPVASFDVALQLRGDKVWLTVENSIAGNTVSISPLLPYYGQHSL